MTNDPYSHDAVIVRIAGASSHDELTSIVEDFSKAYGYLPPSMSWDEAAFETDSRQYGSLLLAASERWMELQRQQ